MFIVLGLPRSRTAWMSYFIGSYHEAIDGCTSLQQYRKKIIHKGDCNTGLALFNFENVLDDFKIVVIDKPVDEKTILFAMSVNGMSYQYNEHYLHWYKRRLDNISGLHIPFDSINDRLPDIWSYVHDKQFNDRRAQIFKDINIQVKNCTKIDHPSLMELLRNEPCLYPTPNSIYQ